MPDDFLGPFKFLIIILMSNKPKGKAKNQTKRQQVQTKEVQKPSTIDNINAPEPFAQPLPVRAQSPSKLPIVKEASIDSEDGQSRKHSQRPNKHKKTKQNKLKVQEQKKIVEQPTKEDEIVYDQYNALKISGLLDAYEHFLKLLCKHGLPTGKVYEYAAQEIEKYQKRKINKQLKMKAELDIQKISKRLQQNSPPHEKPRSPYYS